MNNSLPIGIFDSGIGGLTVYKQLQKLLPGENIIYFGDTERAPYGSRNKEQIQDYVDEIMKLMSLCNIKVGVVACNTITVLGTASLSAQYNFELIGNSLGAKSALAASKNKKIGVIATETTIRSGKHQEEILRLDPEATVVGQACPQFAPMIEEGILDGAELKAYAYKYLQPLIGEKVDTIILACTHYPYIIPLLREVLGENVTIIDPAEDTAIAVKEYLLTNTGLSLNTRGSSQIFFSANPDHVKGVANHLFNTMDCKFQLLDIAPLAKYYSQNLMPESINVIS